MPLTEGIYHIYSKLLNAERQKLAVRQSSTVGEPLEGYALEEDQKLYANVAGYKWRLDAGPEAHQYRITAEPDYYGAHIGWGNEGRPLLTEDRRRYYYWVIKEVDAAYCTIQDDRGRYWALQRNNVGYEQVVLVNRDIGARSWWLLQKI